METPLPWHATIYYTCIIFGVVGPLLRTVFQSFQRNGLAQIRASVSISLGSLKDWKVVSVR